MPTKMTTRRYPSSSSSVPARRAGITAAKSVSKTESVASITGLLGSSDRILPEDLPDSVIDEAVAMSEEGVTPLHDALRDAKKKIILEAIAQAGGNQTEAARLLGVHPNHLFRTIRQLDIRPKK